MSAADSRQALPERAIEQALMRFLARQYPTASDAQLRLAAYLSQQLQDGHICLPLTPASQAQLQTFCAAPLEQLLDKNPLLSADGTRVLVRDQERLYLQRYWQLETRIAAQIQARLDEPLFRASEVGSLLADLFVDSSESPNWQQLACLLAGRKRFGIITGGPGTGKTTSVVRLLALLQQLALASDASMPLRIRLAAPTGKAAARLNESISKAIDKLAASDALRAALPTQVSTLHRLLGYQPGSRHFRHNASNRLDADLVVVDEASMIDMDQLLQLLDALPDSCRLVLVGDKDQLASVEAGAVMHDLCQQADTPAYDADTCAFIEQACGLVLPAQANGSALAQQTVKLQTNWRSKDAPGINTLAQAINRQDIDAAQQAFMDYPQQLQRCVRDHDWILQQLLPGDTGLARLLAQAAHCDNADVDSWAASCLQQLAQQQLLTPLRQGPDGVDALNQRIIEQLRRNRLITDTSLFAGKPLLITRNLYELELMNGDLGLLLNHPTRGWRVAFATDKGMRWLLPEQLEGCSQSAFALSVHKSQGSEFKRVLLYLPELSSPLLTRELVYTAVTRASAEFVLLEGAAPQFANAIAQRTGRHSGLAARLHGHS